MVSPLNPWSRLLDAQASARPLSFMLGMRHEAPLYCPAHSHPAIEIAYHHGGSGVTTLEGQQELRYAEGSVVIYPPDEKHDQTMETPGEDLCIQLSLPRGKCPPKGLLYIDCIESASMEMEIEELARGRTNIDAREKAVLNLRATALLMTLLYSHFSKPSRNNAQNPMETHVLLAEKYIHDNFQGIQSMEEIARFVGISHDHLRHLFKAIRGTSLIRHLNETRIERAKSLLVCSRLPMKQIASICGFRDEYYFSAVFRKLVKLPPLRYRTSAWPHPDADG